MLLSCCLPTLAAGLPTTDDGGGEANLVLPDLTGVSVAWGLDGRALLLAGIVVCLLGLGFGTVTFLRLRQAPVHPSMLEVAELIYSTCQAYLRRQGRFLILLWAFITAVIVVYYKALVGFGWARVGIVVLFSLLGMGGSYCVAWFGIRVNTFANARTAFASLRGKPHDVHRIDPIGRTAVGRPPDDGQGARLNRESADGDPPGSDTVVQSADARRSERGARSDGGDHGARERQASPGGRDDQK